jgi:transcriptional regulator with XRE-family HTH domain
MRRFRQALGDQLRFERARRGISQRQLSLVAAVSWTALSYWERGEHSPTLEGFLSLARALDTPPADLLSAVLARMETRT